MLAKNLSIEAVRCDNAKENINEVINEMLKNQEMQ